MTVARIEDVQRGFNDIVADVNAALLVRDSAIADRPSQAVVDEAFAVRDGVIAESVAAATAKIEETEAARLAAQAVADQVDVLVGQSAAQLAETEALSETARLAAIAARSGRAFSTTASAISDPTLAEGDSFWLAGTATEYRKLGGVAVATGLVLATQVDIAAGLETKADAETGLARVFAGFSDQLGRSPFFILDDAEGTLVNPYLDRNLKRVRLAAGPIFAGFADPDGRSPFYILDDAMGTIRNPWLDAQLADLRTSQGASAYLAPRIVIEGDSRGDLSSVPNRTTSVGWVHWLQMITDARFDYSNDDNLAISGSDTSEVVVRLDGLLNHPAQIAIIVAGTNDRTAGLTAQQTIANLQTIQSAVLAAGKTLIWIAETPRGRPSDMSLALSGQQLLNHQTVRRWQLAQARVAGVFVADPSVTMTLPGDPSAAAYDVMLRDSIHFSASGGLATAQALRPIIEQLLPARPRLPANTIDVFDPVTNPGGALNTNALLLGSAGALGTATGQIADGWALSTMPDGLAVVASKAIIDGLEWQRLVISGTPTTATALSLTAPITTLVQGDQVSAVGAIKGLRSIGLRDAALRINVTYPGAVTDFAAAGYSNDSASRLPLQPWGGVVVTPGTFVMSDTPTAASVGLQLIFNAGEAVDAEVLVRGISANKSEED